MISVPPFGWSMDYVTILNSIGNNIFGTLVIIWNKPDST